MSTTVRIVKTPDVLHGKPRIEGTRVGVFQIGTLVREREWSVEDAAAQFDIDVSQIQAAVEYYDEHPELMETLQAQEEARQQAMQAESRCADLK
ncbi:DUF433 domain-containing protein [Halorubrum vacuolatum]|uniref:Uncharacterized conserved protein, DUF433 family n=1 Tax=Halorubrum vacuolatum TaxID=63740 RepID=A0A238WN90_HALVU|nr:DUF433 domain-containing protein [Halorubrum vacuolatum]SNR48002.1 Uncharacterized conserved protein, DUF433 family [Halorubrum vacuolatum]